MNRAWIELSRDALLHNINEYRRILPKETDLLAIVKADAYGHGSIPITRALSEMGVHFFGVASIDEAIELRKAGVQDDILILGYTDPENFDDLSAYDIIQAIPGPEYGLIIRDFCHRRQKRIRAHIAIDSGMHRIGYTIEQVKYIAELYNDSPLKVCGIFTHMCVANEEKEESVEYTKMQIDYFNSVVDALKNQGIDPGAVHLLSSFAAVNYKDSACDYARIGVLMYGNKTEEADYIAEETDFWPVLSLRTKIVSLRWINPGDTVSYGRWFTADRPTRIATLPVGYADGIPRNLSNGKMRVLVRGQNAYGTGRICMDQMMIDVTDIDGVRIGDTVTIIGKDGDLEIRAEEVAENSDSITHELFSRLGKRIERPERI